MQIAARTIVYDPDMRLMGRIVFLAEAKGDTSALIIEFRVIESSSLKIPDLQGATINLSVRDGEMPKVTIDGLVIAYLNGEAAHYHKVNAAEHYIAFCKESEAVQPEQ